MTAAGQTGGAVLKRWAAVKIDEDVHLVGVLVGGHTRLEAGRWIITSAVVDFDQANMVAVTASSGRRYQLLDRLAMPPPEELRDLLAKVYRAWRLPDEATIELLEL